MSMNEQIRQIIALDRQASGLIAEAQKQVQQLAEDTTAKIKNRRVNVLEETKATCKTNYQVEIDNALYLKENTINKMKTQLASERQAYDERKDAWADTILEEIFREVV